MKHYYKFVLVFLSISVCAVALGQDVIIKNDKTEIKAKVTEITENAIKYKDWSNLDGPVYNINKSQVFMIVYANGKREIIKKEDINTMEMTSTSPNNSSVSQNSISDQLSNQSGSLDTSINYKTQKIKYKPTRLVAGLQPPLSLGIERELRIVKNVFNIGVTYMYNFPKDDYILESSSGFIYGSLYAPINRLTGNYSKQNKGLFVFAQAGYAMDYISSQDYLGNKYTDSYGGFSWRVGADYFITGDFGINISTYKFKTAYAGISFTIL